MQTALQSRQFHIRRERMRRQQRETLRRQRYDLVRRAVARLAPAHPAIRAVYLFGSLVQPGRFTPHSDVDVAVDCGDPAAASRFWQALESVLQSDVDMRSRRGAVAWAVATQGECIYERTVPPA
jgi:predicted nucleotidyltransferase